MLGVMKFVSGSLNGDQVRVEVGTYFMIDGEVVTNAESLFYVVRTAFRDDFTIIQ